MPNPVLSAGQIQEIRINLKNVLQMFNRLIDSIQPVETQVWGYLPAV